MPPKEKHELHPRGRGHAGRSPGGRHWDVDRSRGAVEGRPGERAGEAYGRDLGYGELHGEGDWGWRGRYEHRYGEYSASPSTRAGWDPIGERRPAPEPGPEASGEDWRRGPFAGRGPKGYQRSDERLREEVSERLMRHGHVDASDIEVAVQNGEITLNGTVDSRWAKRMAEVMAESVPGIRDVHNRLTLRRE